MLPAVVLANVPMGAALLVACAWTLFAPRGGTAIITGLIAYGMVTDQTRMQPEFFSLPILLWGTLPIAPARLIARLHLITLWFYAGLAKLLSPFFFAEAGPRLVRVLPLPPSREMIAACAAGIAIVEITAAFLAIRPETRCLCAWFVLAIHGGILLALMTDLEQWNLAVWPWNLTLAASGFALIAPWRTGIVAELGAAPLALRFVAVALLAAPLGFYAGVVDAYPAHQLYSGGTAQATVYCPRGCRPEQDVNATWHVLKVPLPPQPRLFLASFASTCSPGDVLRIDDPHPPPWRQRRADALLNCPAGSLPASHP